jgi:hypothetical protein
VSTDFSKSAALVNPLVVVVAGVVVVTAIFYSGEVIKLLYPRLLAAYEQSVSTQASPTYTLGGTQGV